MFIENNTFFISSPKMLFLFSHNRIFSLLINKNSKVIQKTMTIFMYYMVQTFDLLRFIVL